MTKGQFHRSYVPVQRREARRRALQEANNILTTDRRQRRAAERANKPTPVQLAPSMPRRWTLADLPLLRRRGLIP